MEEESSQAVNQTLGCLGSKQILSFPHRVETANCLLLTGRAGRIVGQALHAHWPTSHPVPVQGLH